MAKAGRLPLRWRRTQAHDLPLADGLLKALPGTPKWVVADRGYSHALRERVWGMGARPAIPCRANEEQVVCPASIHLNRNHVERLWARLQKWRAIATRDAKTARSFLGILHLKAALDWLMP